LLFFPRRFPEECFFLSFTAKVKNTTHNAGNAQTGENVPFWYFQPRHYCPPYYFDDTLGAASFFSRVELFVNDRLIKDEQMSDHGYVYQHINRSFMTPEAQVERYGRTFKHVDVTAERAIGAHGGGANPGTNIPDYMKGLMDSLEFDGRIATKHKTACFSFDGIPLLAAQSNVLRALTGQTVETPFLPPNCVVRIRLHKRDPWEALLEMPQVADAAYWNRANSAEARHEVTLQYKDLTLVYQSKMPEKADFLARAKRAHFFADVPKIMIQSVESGKMYTSNDVVVHPGTKCVILAWMYHHQLFYNKASCKNLCARFKYPTNGKLLKLTMRDHEIPLLFKDGLVNFAIAADAPLEPTCMNYHQWLIQKKLFKRCEIERLFPKAGNSYKQIVIVPLNYMEIKEPTVMTVEIHYDDNASTERVSLCSITLQQYKYHYSEKEGMKGEVVV
jgi:hypothetical protein